VPKDRHFTSKQRHANGWSSCQLGVAQQLKWRQVMDRSELLKAELIAIELWDRLYWLAPNPERYETLAYLRRRDRRAEIITRLVQTTSLFTVPPSPERGSVK
jgi:hypothetical protein